ncbi:MAG: phosphotyrosine protein phosphatase [Myxococcota bacterium]
MNVLFVCSRNRLRSPTAEAVFAGIDGLSVASAGTSPDAEEPVTEELVAWADLILVMEGRHKRLLNRTFGRALRDKRLVVLGIPDDYDYLDPELVALLHERAGPHLARRIDR